MLGIELGRIRALTTPAVLRLHHRSPQYDAAEHAGHDMGVVAADQVTERLVRLACGVDPALAVRERRFVAVLALRDERPSGLPHGVVEDGLQPAVVAEAPRSPAEDPRRR